MGYGKDLTYSFSDSLYSQIRYEISILDSMKHDLARWDG